MPSPQTQTPQSIMLTFFSSNQISQLDLETWLNTDFIPSILTIPTITSATLYKAANPSYSKQTLVVSKSALPPSGLLALFQNLPRTSKTGLFKGSISEHVQLDSRVYTFDQLYEPKQEKRTQTDPPTLLLALMQPPPHGVAELDAWYREEHNEQMSKEPGYWRTERYRLVDQVAEGGSVTSQALSFLAIHVFGEGNVLGKDVEALQPMSEWTKKVMGEAEGIDAAIYHLVRG